MAKTAKSAVSYRDSVDELKMCSGCENFLNPDVCRVVEGRVAPAAVCDLFKPTVSPDLESQMFMGPGGVNV